MKKNKRKWNEVFKNFNMLLCHDIFQFNLFNFVHQSLQNWVIQQCKKTYCHLFSNLWKLHHKWFHTICLLNSLTFMNEFFANILIDCLENTKSTRRALHFVADDEHLTHALPMNNITSQQSFWHSNLLNVKQSHKYFHLFVFRKLQLICWRVF